MKECTKCHRKLPLDNFNKDTRYKNGVKSICRECTSIYNQEYSKRKKRNEYFKKYRQKMKEENKKIDLLEASKILGGYRISILNYAKKGEFKYTIEKVQTNDLFRTNNKKDFLDYLGGELNDR